MNKICRGPLDFAVGKGISRDSVHFSGWRISISGRLVFVYKVMLAVDVPVDLYFFSFLSC